MQLLRDNLTLWTTDTEGTELFPNILNHDHVLKLDFITGEAANKAENKAEEAKPEEAKTEAVAEPAAEGQ